jgi:hypothetical protein
MQGVACLSKVLKPDNLSSLPKRVLVNVRSGGQPLETITAAAPQGNRVTIDSVLYIRQ